MKQKRIVITGGPSGGKTTLIDGLRKELGNKVVVAPEAASILYRGGFPRIKSTNALIHTQKAIYHTQQELEELIADQSPKAPLLVCDRGSLDSIAYWPKSEKNFLSMMGTSRRYELKRYDWVIHLDTAAKDFYDTSNPIRTESFNEAQTLNEKIKHAWREHPRRLIITQNEDFISKMTLSLSVIRAILDGKDYQEIMDELLS